MNCALARMPKNPFASSRHENWDRFAQNSLGKHGTHILNRTVDPEKDLMFVSRSGTCVYSYSFMNSRANFCVDYSGRRFAILEFDEKARFFSGQRGEARGDIGSNPCGLFVITIYSIITLTFFWCRISSLL